MVDFVSGVFINSIDRGAGVCSTLLFLLIGVERYTVLCHPLKSLGWWTSKKVCLLLILVFVVTLAVCIPYGMTGVYEEIFNTRENTTETECFLNLDDQWLRQYETVVNVIFFFLPIPVLLFLYGNIVIALKAKVAQRNNPRSAASRSRSQAARMLVVVLTLFIICLLPFKVYILILLYDPAALDSMGEKQLFILVWFTRLMSYVNHASNPVVYFLMAGSFREAFRDVFCRRCRVPTNQTPP